MAEKAKIQHLVEGASQGNKKAKGRGFRRETTPSMNRPRGFKSAEARRQEKAKRGGSWTGTGERSGRARRRDARKAQREQSKNR